MPPDARWTSITLTTDSNPDEVVAVAASYDSTLAYGAQTPFSDQLAFHWVGSLWEYDAQHDSLITAGNGGTKPVLADFVLYYEPGAQVYDMQQTLQPGDQMWVDVGKLIREHVPDRNGKLLPADVTSGTYEIRDLTNKAVGTLFEGKVVFDKTYGSATYGCAGCCGWVPAHFSLFYDPLGIPVGDGVWQGVEGFDGCINQYDDATYLFDNGWSTANQSIATVDTHGLHTGMGVGSTTTLVASQPIEIQVRPNQCLLQQRSVQGNDNVMANVQISRVTVSPGTIHKVSYPNSATITVQIYHDDTRTISNPSVTVQIATYSTTPSGITVTYSPTSRNVPLQGDSPAVATFTVSSPSGQGTVIIQAALSNAMPSSQVHVVSPGHGGADAQTTLTTEDP